MLIGKENIQHDIVQANSVQLLWNIETSENHIAIIITIYLEKCGF